MTFVADPLVECVIGHAIRVHRTFGPGLYEPVYDTCLCAELDAAHASFRRQVPIALTYLGRTLPCAYRIDLIIEGRLLVELKAVDRVTPIHGAQVLTYLKLSGLKQGLLINFNVRKLADGVRSFVNGLSYPPRQGPEGSEEREERN